MTFDFEAELKKAKEAWGPPNAWGFIAAGEIKIPRGHWPIRNSVNLRGLAGLTLTGEGQQSILYLVDGAKVQMVLDLTGAIGCKLQNFTLRANAGEGIRLARRKDAASSGFHRFDSLTIEGFYAHTALACYASECNTWTHCRFYNAASAPSLIIGNGLDSKFNPSNFDYSATFSTMQTAQFSNCAFINQSGLPESRVIILENHRGRMSDLWFVGGNVSHQGGQNACSMYIDSTSELYMVSIKDMRWESNPALRAIECNSPNALCGFSIEGGSYHQQGELLYAPHTQLYGCDFRRVWCSCEGLGFNTAPIRAHGLSRTSIDLGNAFINGRRVTQKQEFAVI